MVNTYKVLKKNSYSIGSYSLVPIRMQDKMFIKQWRNDQMNILRQNRPLTDHEQNNYFENVVSKLFEQESPQQILFSFLKDGILIGYGGIVHINWHDKRGEISFLLETERNRNIKLFQEDFAIYLNIIKGIAFEELNFNKIYTEAYDLRPYLIETLESSGFVFEGRLKEHICIDNKYVDSLFHAYFKSFFTQEKILERKALNVLVTSISKKVPLLKAVKASLMKIDNRGLLHGADNDIDCIGRYFVDQFWKMPKTHENSLEEILQYCKEKNIKVIIPTRDGELEFWAKHATFFKKENIHICVSKLEAINRTLDKLMFYHFLAIANYPVIQTSDKVEDINTEQIVVKERYGSGSNKIGLKLTRAKAEAFSMSLASPIYQPFIEGIEYSIDAFLDKEGKVKGCIVRERNKVVNGESQITTLKSIDKLEEITRKVAEYLELQGHVVFQIIVDKEDKVHIIECNARFGGASSLSIKAGLDSFYWSFLEVIGYNLSDYPFKKIAHGLKQIRYPEDIIINDSCI